MKRFVMKRFVSVLLVVLMLLSMTVGMSACSKKMCEFFGCEENAMRGSKYCKTHSDLVDLGNDVKDAISDLFK
ncbi:MAG: hypothetical protein LBM60_03380 [Clostridium sp.]|jgi:hypothetical protein|nr:hypothetical protein [Clostridium sp.]